MSYTRLEPDRVGAREGTPALFSNLSHTARVVIWSVLHAALLFCEHLAELLAPFCFIAGALWWALPRGLAAITLDGPPGDVLQMVRSHVPHELYIDGSYYTAGGLITDGVYLIATVAICRTLSTAATRLLLDQR